MTHENAFRILELNVSKTLGEAVFAHEIIKEVSPHWPGIGKYIGMVDDEKNILFNLGENFSCFDYYDKQSWQNCRVYGDEIPLATNRISFVNNLQYAHEQGYSKDISWK